MTKDEDSDLKGNYVDRQDFDNVMKQLGAPIEDDIRKRLYEVRAKTAMKTIQLK